MPLPFVPPAFFVGTGPEIPAFRFTTPPAIDGKVDSQSEWLGTPTQTLGFDDKTGVVGPEESQYWIGYDEEFVYFAAKLKDSQPDKIKATEFRPNVSLNGDDFVGLFLDPFGTLSDGNNFEINPQGATNIRINGGRAAKIEWLGNMLAKTRRTAEGWEVEARIPWSVMRLPEAGERRMRINFYRHMMRTQRTYTAVDISGNRIDQTPVWLAVQLPRISQARTIKMLPYLYGGGSSKDGAIFNSGLDLKLGLTSDLDLVAAVNPDFRNIENQVLNLDFSYFERLAGETRPFFLEGQGYFRTSGDSPLFTPQRIQAFDFGAKTYGKIGDDTQIAVLNTTQIGRENALVANVRQNLGPRTSVTASAANLADPGRNNTGTFIGFNHGEGPYMVFGQYMSTQDQVRGFGQRLNTGAYYSFAGFYGGIEYLSIDPDFLPRLGFAPQRGFSGINGNIGYDRIIPRGPLMEAGFRIRVTDYDATGGGIFRRGINGTGSVTLRDGTDIDFGTTVETFRNFDDQISFIDIERPRGDPYRNLRLNWTWGRVAGKEYRSFAPRINYRPWSRVQLSAAYQQLQHFQNTSQFILSFNYDMTVSQSFSGRLVQQGDDTNFYLAYRRAGLAGAEYFVILGDPNATTFRTSLVVKGVFPFDFKF